MKLYRQPERSTSSENNLVPMINVVFLLLIFFMVAGNIRLSDPLPVTAPESTGHEPVVAKSVLYVSGDGALMLNDDSLSMASLNTALAKLKSIPVSSHTPPEVPRLEIETSDMDRPENENLLAIKADSRVTVMLLREIIEAARTAGLSRVELITTWVPVDAQ